MSVRSAQSVTVVFTTRRFDTGAAVNADSLPAGTLYLNGASNAASVTVTNLATGVYKAAVTLPTLAVNDVVDLLIAATVNGIADNGVIWSDTKDVFAGCFPDVAFGGVGGIGDVIRMSGDSTAADRLESACDGTGYPIGGIAGVVNASVTFGQFSLTSPTIAADSNFVGQLIHFSGGALDGQEFVITASVQSTQVVTIDGAPSISGGEGFYILPGGRTRIGSGDADSITASVLATDAIGSNELATSAVTEIVSAIWRDTTSADFTQANSIGKSILNGGTLGTGLTIVAVSGAVGSVTAGVTVTTNNDKTNYTLTVTPPTAAGIATAVWQDTTSGDFTTSGSIGKSLFTSGNAPGAASGLAIVGSSMGVTGDFSATMKTAIQTAVFEYSPSGGTIGTFRWMLSTGGFLIQGGAISNSTFAAGAIDAAAVANSAWQELIELLFTYDATATYATANAGSAVAQIVDNVDSSGTGGSTAPTAAEVADAVWDEAIAGHLSAGSTGLALSSAGSAGDPWSTLLPGVYANGTAGYLMSQQLLTIALFNAAIEDAPTLDDLAEAVSSNISLGISPDVVIQEDRWRFEAADQLTAVNTITKIDGFDSLLGLQLGPGRPISGGEVLTISVFAQEPADGLTITGLVKDVEDENLIKMNVVASVAADATDDNGLELPQLYTIVFEINTTDSRTIYLRARFLAEPVLG